MPATKPDISEVTALPVGTVLPAAATGPDGYANVRFNALKHGVLSRHTVLSHEDGAEFAALLAALNEEHQPAGATEVHLVEELAGAIWRKRRVLLAEGAIINQGVKTSSRNAERVIPAAVPLEMGMSGHGTDLRDVLSQSPNDVAERQRETLRDLEAVNKADALLRRGGPHSHKRALRALLPDVRVWWSEYLAEGAYTDDAEGLKKFIFEQVYPISLVMEKEARHHDAIMSQTLGEGLEAHRLEKLNRYEVHLDRKFERTLAMLLKLKELRRGG